MPRGVPANGTRRRRNAAGALLSAAQEAAALVAASPVDDPAGDDAPAEAQAHTTPDAAVPEDAVTVVAFGDLPRIDSELAAAVQVPLPAEPGEAAELTAEQQRIKQLETQLAQMAGKRDVEPQIEPLTAPGDDGNIIIHFLEDGFSALGHVWYRGQELEFEPGGRAHKDTFDRYGQSWLELRNDEFGQVDRYGLVMFRSGPWPGKRYAAAAKAGFEKLRNNDGSLVEPPTEEELATAEIAELKRKRAAPHLSSTV